MVGSKELIMPMQIDYPESEAFLQELADAQPGGSSKSAMLRAVLTRIKAMGVRECSAWIREEAAKKEPRR